MANDNECVWRDVLVFASVVGCYWWWISAVDKRTNNNDDYNDFIERVGSNYSENIEKWRNHEFPQHYSNKEVYLDYAGAGLTSASQWRSIHAAQTENIWGNPHSSLAGPASARTCGLIQQAKHAVAIHFDCGADYDIVFTASTTDALRIVAHSFPWSNGSQLVYSHNSHTSVIGMRPVAMSKGATFSCIDSTQLLNYFYNNNNNNNNNNVANPYSSSKHLMVMPLECNFAGDKLPDCKTICSAVSSSPCFFTLVDLARAASHSPISLSQLKPDLAVISFYKIFGYPTGLGALFVNNKRVKPLLQNLLYFGGGAVDFVSAHHDICFIRSPFEHGTSNYHGIVALLAGFQELKRVGGMQTIQRHTASLASELVRRLREMRHYSTTNLPVVQIYGDWANVSTESLQKPYCPNWPGPTIAFNILASDGSYIGYNEVAKLAILNTPSIQLRTGCFCNPGACQKALQWTDSQLLDNYHVMGHKCGDDTDLINGRPTGALRVSLGKDSTYEDIKVLLNFIHDKFVSRSEFLHVPTTSKPPSKVKAVMSEIYIYPIKSCRGISVQRCVIHNGHLKYDRQFALVDSSGEVLRLAKFPKMAHIRPFIDFERHLMIVTCPKYPTPLTIDLNVNDEYSTIIPRSANICGTICQGQIVGDQLVSEWFTNYLCVPCWLVQHSPNEIRDSKGDNSNTKHDNNTNSNTKHDKSTNNINKHTFAFANESPFLAIYHHSLEILNQALIDASQPPVTAAHFRPNFVLKKSSSLFHDDSKNLPHLHHHEEDVWTRLTRINHDCCSIEFKVTGPCSRCASKCMKIKHQFSAS